MKVLHIYPQNNSMIAQYVSMLQEDGSLEVKAIDDAKQLQQLCQEWQPSIVHQHGSSPEITRATQKARTQGVRIVVTPHGQLEPWETSGKIRINNMLEPLVSHAYAVIARGPMEAEELRKLDWNTRIEMVMNPIVTRSTTPAQLNEAHQRIYQQVMDSNVLELMDEPTQTALRTLLKAGITEDERWVAPFDAEATNWRLLFIYAEHEGISSYIERGMLAMGMTVPLKTVTSSYLPNHFQRPVTQSGKSVIELIRSIQQFTDANRLSLLSLAELDLALRRDDVEDDVLIQQLKSEKLLEFFKALLPVLHQQTGLDEGFMPCEPAENSETDRIRNCIKKHLEI